jgi:hypothetical protein
LPMMSVDSKCYMCDHFLRCSVREQVQQLTDDLRLSGTAVTLSVTCCEKYNCATKEGEK